MDVDIRLFPDWLSNEDIPYDKLNKRFFWSNLEYPALCDGTYVKWDNLNPPFYPDGKPYWVAGDKNIVWVPFWTHW